MSVSRRGGSRGTAVIGAVAVVAAAALATGVASADASTTSASSTYLVVYKEKTSTSGAGGAVAAAGGQVVATYAPISVVVARSASPDFATKMRQVTGVEGAVATTRFASAVDDGAVSADTAADATTTQTTANGAGLPGLNDSLSGLQWDMTQIKVGEAHAISTGDPSILVGDIDTGLDYTHPDLAPNVDSGASANCVSGVAVPGAAAAADDNGHGTHTAGTIAAAANGIGIVGVAPNVKIAGIKAGNADGFFFPEAVVCSFMWAADHGVDVTNNSYFADPWLFNCRNDAEQRAIWTAERRAIKYAQNKGVLVVAAEGNQADDLSHPTLDATSPDDTNPVLRAISNACAVVPTEVPGVVGRQRHRQQGDEVVLLVLRHLRRRRRRAGRRLHPPADRSRPQRTGAVDLARVPARGDVPRLTPGRRRERSDVLLPAGHLDGLAARRRRRSPHRECDRQDGRGALGGPAERRQPDRRARPTSRRTPSSRASTTARRSGARAAAARTAGSALGKWTRSRPSADPPRRPPGRVSRPGPAAYAIGDPGPV